MYLFNLVNDKEHCSLVGMALGMALAFISTFGGLLWRLFSC